MDYDDKSNHVFHIRIAVNIWRAPQAKSSPCRFILNSWFLAQWKSKAAGWIVFHILSDYRHRPTAEGAGLAGWEGHRLAVLWQSRLLTQRHALDESTRTTVTAALAAIANKATALP